MIRAAAIVLLALPFGVVSAAPNVVLAQGEGRELVQAHCGSCHSLALVTAQRGDRLFWLGLIRWMQANHNLWTFDETTERGIVDYLHTHYGREGIHPRRARLSPEFLPES